MPLFGHRHWKHHLSADHPLAGKKVYIPIMAEGSSEIFAAVFRWLGAEAEPTPRSNARTRELGGKFTAGDECYPAKVTVGDFLRIVEQPGFDPSRTAFFMPTAEGPCRFGQYAPFLGKILREAGYGDVKILSPTSANGYADLGNVSRPFLRAGWRALVCGDILNRVLLKTRPYETEPGAADRAYEASLQDICKTMASSCADPDCQLRSLVESLRRARERFLRVPAHYDPETPLIGIVGEIFCRLNTFSNEDLVRKLEGYGAECCLSLISEWVSYTNSEQKRKLRLQNRTYSLDMLGAYVRASIQLADEHALMKPFHDDFRGYEEDRKSVV